MWVRTFHSFLWKLKVPCYCCCSVFNSNFLSSSCLPFLLLLLLFSLWLISILLLLCKSKTSPTKTFKNVLSLSLSLSLSLLLFHSRSFTDCKGERFRFFFAEGLGCILCYFFFISTFRKTASFLQTLPHSLFTRFFLSLLLSYFLLDLAILRSYPCAFVLSSRMGFFSGFLPLCFSLFPRLKVRAERT